MKLARFLEPHLPKAPTKSRLFMHITSQSLLCTCFVAFITCIYFIFKVADYGSGFTHLVKLPNVGQYTYCRQDAFASTIDPRVKTILLWNTFFKQADYIPPLKNICPEQLCYVTSDRSKDAHAVIVHLRDIDASDVPKRKSPDQVFALLNAEAPPYAPPIPESLNSIFNWTITYREDSEIPLINNLEIQPRYGNISPKDYYANKTKMATWFVSHCHTNSERETLVHELSNYGIQVDVVGACGTLTCSRQENDKCFKKFSEQYFFYLSFDNAICKDYVTEKFFNVLQLGEMVPVVLGGANYSKFAPPKSYINVNEFKSVEELAFYLKKVAKDRELYNSYHQWRAFFELRDPVHYACKLCAKLHTKYNRRTYDDFNQYWHQNACYGNWKQAFRL